MSHERLAAIKHICIASHLDYTRYMFPARYGSKFIISPHHFEICNALDRVFSGEITRLIINVCPRYSKTELAVINLAARGFALNKKSRFIHVSYSGELAYNNSRLAREMIELQEYHDLWPLDVSKSDHGKKKWEIDGGGGMLAVPSGGAITGFGAGDLASIDEYIDKTGNLISKTSQFSGAILVDDPLKPKDARSDAIRKTVNEQFTETLASRLAHPGIPIVVIKQRLHEDDPTAHLLKGGMNGEFWHHLCLPNPIPEKPERYNPEYTHGIPIPHSLQPGPLWPLKHTLEQLQQMEKFNPYTYYSQYAQQPTPPGGSIFTDDCFHFYDVLPQLKYRFITADTAMKTGEHNDFSVFQCWGVGKDNNLYLIDQIRGKWEAPKLEQMATMFWQKHKNKPTAKMLADESAYGDEHQEHTEGDARLRYMAIEDKSSGTGLIQKIKKDNEMWVKPIPRNIDKITRAHDGVPYMFMGKVLLPSPDNVQWMDGFLSECRKFNGEKTHLHDDQIDPMLDAIDETFGKPEGLLVG